jgi:uncharacterized protein (DUF1919 family)
MHTTVSDEQQKAAQEAIRDWGKRKTAANHKNLALIVVHGGALKT